MIPPTEKNDTNNYSNSEIFPETTDNIWSYLDDSDNEVEVVDDNEKQVKD